MSIIPIIRAAAFFLLSCYSLSLAALVGGDESRYLGPSELVSSPDGKTLFVANAEAGEVAAVDLQTGVVAARIDVPLRPTGVGVARDGRLLYVTCAGPRSVICVIDPRTCEVLARIPVGHTAMGPTLHPGQKLLYVCNRFDNGVSIVDLDARREVARIEVVREPVAAAITPDGGTLVVANHLPADRSDSFFVTPMVAFIDTRTRAAKHVRLPNGATGLRDVCLSPDGRRAFATHTIGNYELVPSNVAGGWTNINALSILDVRGKKLINTIKLDDPQRGAANPWGMACSQDGRWLVVAHAGTHELSAIDLPGLLGKLEGGVYASPAAGGIPYDPGILEDIRRRIPLRVKGPRAVVVIGSKAHAAGYFSDAVEAVDLNAESTPAATITLGPALEWTRRRRGEFLFHDATECFQQWQSCASCHPDARADGFNWDLMNDGVGNPKNTKSMLLAHRTPPAMVTGVRPDAESAVRAGIEHILFADLPEEDARAIDSYLRSLRPVPSPRLVDGRLNPAARRGKRLFHNPRVGCAVCHPAPLFTDRKLHEMGDPGPYDLTTRFDTPTLIEVWRTAPYLHDGRYLTVKELLIKGKHGLGGGRLERLSQQDLDDLAEFVLSL